MRSVCAYWKYWNWTQEGNRWANCMISNEHALNQKYVAKFLNENVTFNFFLSKTASVNRSVCK